uniref:Protein KTI12 homolog n=1 Tax=Magallana gigas TaxID=29159 RepID=K1QCI9_MAGGI
MPFVLVCGYPSSGKNSIEEKEIRGKLKSEVQRLLNKDDIVILDSLNYIKGFRYELYCITKACKTPQCVIFCAVSKEKAAEWNKELMMRFEEPNSNQRWDSPLFVIHPEDELPYDQISDALFNRKPPPPNMATQNNAVPAFGERTVLTCVKKIIMEENA